jgi:hypothetical protein
MSRITLTHSPVTAPNQCAICGSSTIGNGFVDPHLDIEFYGSIYFCEFCVIEMASLYGALSAGKAKMLEEENNYFNKEFARVNKRLKEVETLNDALSTNLRHYKSTSPISAGAGSNQSNSA